MRAMIKPNQAGIKPNPTEIKPNRIETKPNPNQIQSQNQAIKILEDHSRSLKILVENPVRNPSKSLSLDNPENPRILVLYFLVPRTSFVVPMTSFVVPRSLPGALRLEPPPGASVEPGAQLVTEPSAAGARSKPSERGSLGFLQIS